MHHTETAEYDISLTYVMPSRVWDPEGQMRSDLRKALADGYILDHTKPRIELRPDGRSVATVDVHASLPKTDDRVARTIFARTRLSSFLDPAALAVQQVKEIQPVGSLEKRDRLVRARVTYKYHELNPGDASASVWKMLEKAMAKGHIHGWTQLGTGHFPNDTTCMELEIYFLMGDYTALAWTVAARNALETTFNSKSFEIHRVEFVKRVEEPKPTTEMVRVRVQATYDYSGFNSPYNHVRDVLEIAKTNEDILEFNVRNVTTGVGVYESRVEFEVVMERPILESYRDSTCVAREMLTAHLGRSEKLKIHWVSRFHRMGKAITPPSSTQQEGTNMLEARTSVLVRVLAEQQLLTEEDGADWMSGVLQEAQDAKDETHIEGFNVLTSLPGIWGLQLVVFTADMYVLGGTKKQIVKAVRKRLNKTIGDTDVEIRHVAVAFLDA